MLDHIEYATGTCTGYNHLNQGKIFLGESNDDAVAIATNERAFIGVLCDGCGSAKHSEVGSHLGANLIATAALDFLSTNIVIHEWLPDTVEANVSAELRILANRFPGRLRLVVRDYFLFATAMIIITSHEAAVYVIGDACVYPAGGALHSLGPFPDNAPPYFAYCSLVPSDLGYPVKFSKLWATRYETPASLTPVMIGSDGLVDLQAAQSLPLPGKKEPAGPLDQFFEDRYFAHADAITMRLRLMNASGTETRRKRIPTTPFTR